MIPYEKNDRLATITKDGHYELHKRKVISNVARNSMVFLTSETEDSVERRNPRVELKKEKSVESKNMGDVRFISVSSGVFNESSVERTQRTTLDRPKLSDARA